MRRGLLIKRDKNNVIKSYVIRVHLLIHPSPLYLVYIYKCMLCHISAHFPRSCSFFSFLVPNKLYFVWLSFSLVLSLYFPPKIIYIMDTKVLSSGIHYSKLPESYIRPESDRPCLSEVSEFENVPIIDLGSHNRTQIVQQIGEACSSYGFFQV